MENKKGKKLSEEEFLKRLEDVHGKMIEAVEPYVNARTPMKFFCHHKDEFGNEHGEFTKIPYEVVNLKRKCSKCYNLLPFGYWNDLNNCIQEASKYLNKNELEKKRYGCYMGFFRNGWQDKLNEIFKEKVIQYRNVDLKIHLIYVYEIKELNTCYVGRTNDLKRRDRQHRKGCKHSNGIIEYDNLWKFCNKNDIKIPQPIILEENLNALESQRQEEYWLNEYINNGWETINVGVVGVNRGSLGASFKWTYDKCKEIADKCKNKEEFKRVNQSAHNSARKNGWINDFFKQDKKPNGYWNDLNNCIEESKKYKNIKEFSIKGGGAYNAVRKNGFLEFIDKKEIKPKGYWNDKEHCLTEAKKYKTVYELEKSCYGCYLGLKRNNWLKLAFSFKNKPFGYWNIKENVIKEGLKYNSKTEFKKNSGGAFKSAIKHDWMNEIEVNFHKEIKHYNYEDKIHLIYVYEIKDFNVCYVGRTINLHKRDLSHRRTVKHHDGRETMDGLLSFCKENNIEIPMPIVLEENLNAKESLIQEDYWLNYYLNNGWKSLNKAKTGINSGSLGSVNKYR